MMRHIKVRLLEYKFRMDEDKKKKKESFKVNLSAKRVAGKWK